MIVGIDSHVVTNNASCNFFYKCSRIPASDVDSATVIVLSVVLIKRVLRRYVQLLVH